MMRNYEYTTNALLIRKDVGDIQILVTAKLPDYIGREEALDVVLDAILEIADKMPDANDEDYEGNMRL